MQFYEFAHSIGVHAWDLPALAVVLVMVIVGLIHWRRQSRRNDKFEAELNEKIQEIRGASATESGGKGGV